MSHGPFFDITHSFCMPRRPLKLRTEHLDQICDPTCDLIICIDSDRGCHRSPVQVHVSLSHDDLIYKVHMKDFDSAGEEDRRAGASVDHQVKPRMCLHQQT